MAALARTNRTALHHGDHNAGRSLVCRLRFLVLSLPQISRTQRGHRQQRQEERPTDDDECQSNAGKVGIGTTLSAAEGGDQPTGHSRPYKATQSDRSLQGRVGLPQLSRLHHPWHDGRLGRIVEAIGDALEQ